MANSKITHDRNAGNLDAPMGPLTTPDGRQIRLTVWEPNVSMDSAVTVRMEGILCYAPEHNTEDKAERIALMMDDIAQMLRGAADPFAAAKETIKIPK